MTNDKLQMTNNKVINEAIFVLKRGGVVAFPTETSYGLARDMGNAEAVEKVYKMKGRPFQKPLSIIVASVKMAQGYVDFSPYAMKLAEKYWPGALTLVLPITLCHPESGEGSRPKAAVLRFARFLAEARNDKNKSAHSIFLFPDQTTLAVRVSSHLIAQALVEKLGRPISATSANVSGEENIYDPVVLKKQFEGREYMPDLMLDAGVLPRVAPSTIVEIIGDKARVVRQGAIQIENDKVSRYSGIPQTL